MKKFIVFFMMVLFPLIGIAQTGHLKFLGIPMGASAEVFAQQLEKKGFKRTYGNSPMELDGIVADNSAHVHLLGGDNSNYGVCNVSVSFSFWSNRFTSELYNDLMPLLNKNYKLEKEKVGESSILSIYSNSYGEVQVQYWFPPNKNASINLLYRDYANCKAFWDWTKRPKERSYNNTPMKNSDL